MTHEWTVGVDWGSTHQLCVMHHDGAVLGQRTVTHTSDDVHAALRWLHEITQGASDAIAIGVETPRGILVDTLLEHGLAVFAINPKQLDKFRDRFSAAGAKDDRRDARVLADALRTDQRAFHRVRADDPQVIYLRELCRIAEESQQTVQALANRLREQLYRVDAAWLALCAAADEAWLWDLLRTTPHPEQWPRLSRTRIARVLRTHRIRRIAVDDVVTALQQPRLRAAAGIADAVALRIASLVPQLRLVTAQRHDADRQIEPALVQLAESSEGQPHEHRDVVILRSLPGVGRMVAATMLTEAAGPLAERDYPTLRAHSGAAPVTKRSSKRTYIVHMRYACKQRLRHALYHWSFASLQHDAAARDYYDRLRARGHRHARALRRVADRWLRILIAMLQTRTLYDPSRFQHATSH